MKRGDKAYIIAETDNRNYGSKITIFADYNSAVRAFTRKCNRIKSKGVELVDLEDNNKTYLRWDFSNGDSVELLIQNVE